MSRAGQLELERRRQLVWSCLGFASWQGADLLRLTLTPARAVEIALVLIGIAGAAVWIFQLVRMRALVREVKQDEELASALMDERYLALVRRAFTIGFFILLATLAIVFAASLFLPLSVRVVAQLCILVGVTSSIITLLVLDRE